MWVYVSSEKWNKAKIFIEELKSIIDKGEEEEIPFKFLERGRGFMVYFCRTYTSFVLYLKGIHLTLDSWRPNRNAEGWKIKKVEEAEDFIEEQPEDLDEARSKEWLDPLTLEEARAKSRESS